MSLQEKITEWVKLYLLSLSIAVLVIASGTLLYATLTNTPFLNVLRWTLVIGIVVLIGMGPLGMLTLSEYSYISPNGRGRAGVNPAIIREGVRHMSEERKPKKKIWIVLGMVGLTLLPIYFLIFP